MRSLAVLLLLPLAACSAIPQSLTAPVSSSADWRAVATPNDRSRLRDWRKAFTEALAQARSDRHGAAIVREGRLLQPDAAIGPVPIANGNYRCRVIKLGARSPGAPTFTPYPAFDCQIAAQGPLQSFAKLSGSQRQIGLLYRADALRQVFLGTLVLGDERNAMHYGRDPDRDVAGWVERIGDNRWRLILPYPRYESTLDVIELVPAT
jgi:hypothetical protein